MDSWMLKSVFCLLGLLGTAGTWGRSLIDGTLVNLLQALHGGPEYILPGTKEALRTTFTGIYWPIDYLLDVLVVFFWEAVDGSHPATSVIGIYFLGQYFSILTGFYVDSFRHGQTPGYHAKATLWMLVFQLTAVACSGAPMALWYIASSPLVLKGVQLANIQIASLASPLAILLVIPSLMVGYAGTAVAMGLASPGLISTNSKQLAIVAWNLFPILVSTIHWILSRLGDSVFGYYSTAPDSKGAARSHIRAVRVTNCIALFTSCAFHIAVTSLSITALLFPNLFASEYLSELRPATLFVPPLSFTRGTTVGHGVRSFLLWDQVIGYSVMTLVAVLQLRTVMVAKGMRFSWIKIVIGAVAGALFLGPGSVCLLINWRRDEILFDSNGNLSGKGKMKM